MKKALKILSFILVFTLAILPIVSIAVPIDNLQATGNSEEMQGLNEIVGLILNIIMYVGYAIAVVMVLWLGVQWIMATPNKKADLKGKMWNMGIGIFLLVGGVTILNFVWDLATKTNDVVK